MHGRGSLNGDILIIGEAYGVEEEKQNKPFVGSSGKELERMLREAHIDPADCFFTNVVNKRPLGNQMHKFFVPTADAKKHGIPPFKGLYPGPEVLEGLNELSDLIEAFEPRLIITCGNYPLWALTEGVVSIGNSQPGGWKVPTGIAQYRGSQLRSVINGIPLLPVYHPAAVLRNWPWRVQTVHDLRVRSKMAGKVVWDEPPRDFIIKPSFDDTMECLQNILLKASLTNNHMLLACDIETLGGFLECIGFAWSQHQAICIPLMTHENKEGYWSAAEEVAIMSTIRKVLEHPNIEIVGQNFIYDYQYFFHYYGIVPNYRQDTMIAHNVCYPGTPMGLGYLSSMYCGWHKFWKDDGKEASKAHDDTQRWLYSCRDCVVTYEVMETLWQVIKFHKQELQYTIQMTRARAIIKAMMRGIAIDFNRRNKELETFFKAEQDLAYKLNKLVPKEMLTPSKTPWYRSPIQQMTLFYETLGVKKVLSTKNWRPTVDDDALVKIKTKEPLLAPLITLLQEYRQLSTYSQFIQMKLSDDRRMRASFSPTTETFRYRSSSDAFGSGRNLQNLPTGTEE